MPLILTPGRQYIDRKGNLWTVVSVTPGWRYPCTARKADGELQSFTSDGRWSHHVTWPNDIVGEAGSAVVATEAA